MIPPSRQECIDHLRLSALGYDDHIQNKWVIEMHTKADDGFLNVISRRVEVFTWLADWFQERENAAKADNQRTAANAGGQAGSGVQGAAAGD